MTPGWRKGLGEYRLSCSGIQNNEPAQNTNMDIFIHWPHITSPDGPLPIPNVVLIKKRISLMVENFTKYFKWPPQVSDDKKKLITKHYPFHDSVISTFSLTRLGIGHEVWF